ncbi:uncharacterized protein LOC111894325 [Lactuca sativa]|uniref:Uncharacterized protein n=1 Tax=Lactuca sativa TaxID=4236 RepID=A0A9R1UHU7_LACSA|nr:uncharacterized protein LOC111894325 [Lactuca sativa]KAJ0187256.1 hypothetical protein LSAT_V11C900486950 [Lactuca sativa]
MDGLWMLVQPPANQPVLPVIPRDAYYPELPVAYNPIPPVEEAPIQQEEIEIEENPEEDMEEDPEEDPEEDIEVDPEEEPEEDMDEEDNDEVIMITESESSVTPPSTPIHSFTTAPSRCPKRNARMSVPDRRPTTLRQSNRFSHT